MAKQDQKLFRVGAAAHELGLHLMTMRHWSKAARIQVVQVGREMHIPRTEIERLVGQSDERLWSAPLVPGHRGWKLSHWLEFEALQGFELQ